MKYAFIYARLLVETSKNKSVTACAVTNLCA